MCFVDLEPCKVWEEHDRKARKEHTCSECRRTIRIGEVYTAHFSVFEGDATVGKLCSDCKADRDEFADAHDSNECQPGYLRNMVRSCIGEGGDDDDKWRALVARIDARGNAA